MTPQEEEVVYLEKHRKCFFYFISKRNRRADLDLTGLFHYFDKLYRGSYTKESIASWFAWQSEQAKESRGKPTISFNYFWRLLLRGKRLELHG